MQTREEKQVPSARRQALTTAARDFLRALGYPEKGELAGTPERVARLWDEALVPVPPKLPQMSSAPDLVTSSTSVLFGPVAVHLICPHHLTVAQGKAEVAYAPGGSFLGLGEIAKLVYGLAADLLLQETLGQRIAQALTQTHGAGAAWVRLSAHHVCGSLSMPETHGARLVTVAVAGDVTLSTALRAWAEAESRRAL